MDFKKYLKCYLESFISKKDIERIERIDSIFKNMIRFFVRIYNRIIIFLANLVKVITF